MSVSAESSSVDGEFTVISGYTLQRSHFSVRELDLMNS